MIIVEDLREGAWCQGRNGAYDIREIRLWDYGGEGADRCVKVDLISRKRGIRLNAGFTVHTEDMDRLAQAWLESRGYVLSPPQEKESV